MIHSTKVPRQDDIMMDSAEVENKHISSKGIAAWFAKSLCFHRICIETRDLSTEKDNLSLNMSNNSLLYSN